jgi:hypothetical protein
MAAPFARRTDGAESGGGVRARPVGSKLIWSGLATNAARSTSPPRHRSELGARHPSGGGRYQEGRQISDILRFPIPADTGLHQKRLRRLIHTDLVCGAISMLQEVSQTFIRLRPRFTAVVTRPDRRLCPTTPALLRPSGTRFPRKRNSPAQRQMAQNRLLRLAEPGGMSYASVLSSTARAWSPRVFGEHGRSRAFCGEYPATPS